MGVESEEFSDQRKEKGREFTKQVKRVLLGKRIYWGESGIFTNDAPKFGLGRGKNTENSCLQTQWSESYKNI